MEQAGAIPPGIGALDRTEPAVVHQASGMLAVRLGISCSAALDHMRRHATRTAQSLPDVARAVVVNRSVDLRE
jgi:AmiR/NasT family two-component response regulator